MGRCQPTEVNSINQRVITLLQNSSVRLLEREDPAFEAKELRQWLAKLGTGTPDIEPGSPWGNRYCESFNGKLRDGCLYGEVFYSLKEAQIVIEKWRVVVNKTRPHPAFGCQTPTG